MSSMDGLIEFLRACIAERETAATEAMVSVGTGMWQVEDDPYHPGEYAVAGVDGVRIVREDDGGLGREVCEHIALNDPASVLAECEAKLRIVKEHTPEYGPRRIRYCTRCAEPDGTGYADYSTPWPCPILRLLALPYADRPGYREEWKL